MMTIRLTWRCMSLVSLILACIAPDAARVQLRQMSLDTPKRMHCLVKWKHWSSPCCDRGSGHSRSGVRLQTTFHAFQRVAWRCHAPRGTSAASYSEAGGQLTMLYKSCFIWHMP